MNGAQGQLVRSFDMIANVRTDECVEEKLLRYPNKGVLPKYEKSILKWTTDRPRLRALTNSAGSVSNVAKLRRGSKSKRQTDRKFKRMGINIHCNSFP